MIYLVTGGAACGKSSFAEDILMKCTGRKYYIATMHKDGNPETLNRVLRHQELRKNKGFETLELETDIAKARDIIADSMRNAGAADEVSVIIECMSNLLANEMYISNRENPSAYILDSIKEMSDWVHNMVIVTNEVASDGLEYDAFVNKYIYELMAVNSGLSRMADAVIEVVYSVPVIIKGGIAHENMEFI
jgi:adenosylcobinamide kinase/adenosylcobinamide-phosphate guanylyltransferase